MTDWEDMDLEAKRAQIDVSKPLAWLNAASFTSPFRGLNGMCAPEYYKALQPRTLSPEGMRLAWGALVKSALATRNVAVVVRAFCELTENPPLTHEDLAILRGHVWHIFARDVIRSAHAYVTAAQHGDEDALCAAIGLQRLLRRDPQSDEVRHALDGLKRAGLLDVESKESLENRLATLDVDDESTRARAHLELAVATLLDWGDTSRALDWIELALGQNDEKSRIVRITSAVARAMVDVRPTLLRCVKILDYCEAHTIIGRLSEMTALFALEQTSTDDLDLIFARTWALNLDDETRAAHFFYQGTLGLNDTAEWQKRLRKHEWIGQYAASHGAFWATLQEVIRQVHTPDVELELYASVEKYAQGETACQCALGRARRLTLSGRFEDALRAVTSCFGEKGVPDRSVIRRCWDAFVDLAHASAGQNAFALTLREAGQRLLQQSGDAAGYDILDRLLSRASSNDMLQRATQDLRSQWPDMDDSSESLNPAHSLTSAPPRVTPTDACPTDGESFRPPALSSTSGLIAPKDYDDFAKVLFYVEHDAEDEACALFFDKCATTPSSSEHPLNALIRLDEAISTRHGQNDPSKHELVSATLAFILSEGKDESRNALTKIAGNDDEQWKTVARTLLRYVPFAHDGHTCAQLVLEICQHRLTLEQATEVLVEQFSHCVQFDSLFDQVSGMTENTQNQRQMLEKLDAAIAVFVGDVSQKNALYAKKYRLADLMGDERVKMMCLRDILETTPEDPFALGELQKVQPDAIKPHSQILYYQLLIYVDKNPAQRLEHQMILATLYSRASQVNNAINLYYAIIDERPDFLEARYRLLELLQSLENWKSAENILLALVNVETSDTRRILALKNLASIQADHMMMPARALLTCFAIIDLDPMQLNAMHEQMCDISERAKSFAALLDKYQDLASHAKTYEIRRMANVLLANVYAERLDNSVSACHILDAFFEKEGQNDAEFLKVVLNFYDDVHHWTGYVKVITALTQIIAQPDERAQLALAGARVLALQLNEPIRAAQFARLAAQCGPTNPELWLEIANHLLQINAIQDVMDALAQAEKLENRPQKKLPILIEMTHLYIENGQLAPATAIFHQIVDLAPPLEQFTPIAEELIALATAQKNHDVFNELCDALVQSCPESEQTSLLLQQALTLILVFDDKTLARHIIDENTHRLDAIDLEQCLILAQILTKLDEAEAAIRLIRGAMQSFSLDTNTRFELLKNLLECAINIDDNELVRSAANAILQVDSDNTVANFALIQLDYHTGKWDEASHRIEQFLPHLERLSAENAMLLHYYYGEILYAAQHADIALECLDNALRIRTDFRPVVDLKLKILLEMQRWPEALPVFNLLLKLSDDPEVQGAIHKRIAETYHFYLHDNDRAVQEYEIALALGGDVEDVPMRLLDLYQKVELWNKAALTAQVLAQAQVASPRVKCKYLLTLGDIQANQLNDAVAATNTQLEAFVLDPFSMDTLTPLMRLLLKKQDWDNLCGLFDFFASHIAENPQKARERLLWLAQTTGQHPQCKQAMIHASVALKKNHLDADLFEEAKLHPIQLSTAPRKRTSTSPQLRITTDSALISPPSTPTKITDNASLPNPSHDNPNRSTPPDTKDDNDSSVPLIDDALIPLMSGSSFPSAKRPIPTVGTKFPKPLLPPLPPRPKSPATPDPTTPSSSPH